MILFEFQLDNDILGPQIINECDGWSDAKLKLERDKNFKSLIEYFDGSFIFYGNNGVVNGGIDYINEVELTQGLDAEIRIYITVSFDGYTFEPLFTGQLNLALSQRFVDNKIQIPIVRDDFWAKFINRLDTPVNIQSELSLDDVDVNNFDSINLTLTNQKIRKQYLSEMDIGQIIFETEWIDTQYLQIGFDTNTLSEIEETFEIPTAINPEIPVYILSAIEAGDYNFDIRIECSSVNYTVIDTPLGIDCYNQEVIDSTETIINFYIQKNEETPILFTVTNSPLVLTRRSSWYQYLDNIYLEKGDTIKFYGDLIAPLDNGAVDNFIIWGKSNGVTVKKPIIGIDPSFPDDCFWTGLSFEVVENLGSAPSFSDNPTYFSIYADTVYPETNAFSFLLHDAAGQICDRIISQNDTFYSEHLGSDRTIYRQYNADGCGWKYAIAKGLQIRQYSLIEKPFFLSFNQWWRGINPVLCLGLGYEEIDGNQVIRVEELEHFYDGSETSLDISNVRQITRVYDQDVIFKTVKVGYSKWQSEDISGIDDPQTKHTYATRFVKTGTDLTIESEFIAASLAIETTRRTTRIKSADYKFDNDTFLIAINPIPVDVSPETSPDVNDFVPELDENFSSITNLLNSDTRYNSRITPARNLIRWIKYISGCLQSYIDSKFKFVSGEGNYDMESDMVNTSDGCDEIKTEVSEKEDLPVYNDPLHLPMLYEIVVPMEWEDYLTIRENRKKAIGISQTTTGHVKFFIESLEYELVKSKATIKAWPKEFFEIQVIDELPAMRTCIPAVLDNCEDAYLTEDSFELETEDGNCLILQ